MFGLCILVFLRCYFGVDHVYSGLLSVYPCVGSVYSGLLPVYSGVGPIYSGISGVRPMKYVLFQLTLFPYYLASAYEFFDFPGRYD